MSISDMIQTIAIITSLVVSIVAILQTRTSIKMTQKSIEDANRPYIAIYVETTEISSFSKHFVIKNFGSSSAKILSITFNADLDKINNEKKMQSLVNGTVAPEQKFTSAMDPHFKETIEATIVYSDLTGKIYTEVSSIKTDMSSQLLWSSPSNSKDSSESTAIKQATNAIIKAFK